MDEKMKRCMDSCMECSKVCMQMVMHCLEKGGKHAEPSHIRLLLDCAEICKLSASFMARNSDYAHQLCELCAEICEQCAESCEAMEDDEDMASCAETCRKCAEDCRAMANA